jgi:hypothetical protein
MGAAGVCSLLLCLFMRGECGGTTRLFVAAFLGEGLLVVHLQ